MNGTLKAFEYKISLGQNFILDQGLQSQLVELTRIRPGDTVLEIGSGRGDMTEALAERCKRLVSVEIDSRLEPVLRDRFSAHPHVEIVIGDIMKLDLQGLIGARTPFHAAGNLPYYLTTPILMKFLRTGLPVMSLNVMVQKEAALRVRALPGTPEYGPLAVLAAYRGTVDAEKLVPARCFTPPPKVDSIFLAMPFHAHPPVSVNNEKVFFQLVDNAFLMRRKTLANNLMSAYAISRDRATILLHSAGLDEKVRGEKLSLADFASLSNQISEYLIQS